MITRIENTFVLSTNQTTYAFSALKTGHLEHLYYGRKIAAFLPESIRKVCWAESERKRTKTAISLPERRACLKSMPLHRAVPTSRQTNRCPSAWRISIWKCPLTGKATSGSLLWKWSMLTALPPANFSLNRIFRAIPL